MFVQQSRQVKSSVEIRQELPELEVFKVNSIVLHWIWVAAQSVSRRVSQSVSRSKLLLVKAGLGNLSPVLDVVYFGIYLVFEFCHRSILAMAR